jgi:hypothetical protein
MNKRILISTSVIALLLLYIIIARVGRRSEVPVLPKWEGRADEIIINRPGNTVKLYKKNGKWVVNEEAYPADEKVVSEIETRFRNINLEDLISKKGFYNKYDLTPDKYSEVIIKKGDVIFRKFKIGKKSSTGRHTFVRIDDKPDIYLAEGTFDLLLNRKLDDFRDKEILKINRDAITGLSIEYRGKVFTLYRKASKKSKTDANGKSAQVSRAGAEEWACRGYESTRLDTGKVWSLLSSLDSLRASSFQNVPKESFTPPVCAVRIKTYKKEIVLSIFEKDKQFIGTTSEQPYVFVLDKWAVENFFITGIDKLKAEEK